MHHVQNMYNSCKSQTQTDWHCPQTWVFWLAGQNMCCKHCCRVCSDWKRKGKKKEHTLRPCCCTLELLFNFQLKSFFFFFFSHFFKFKHLFFFYVDFLSVSLLHSVITVSEFSAVFYADILITITYHYRTFHKKDWFVKSNLTSLMGSDTLHN